MAKVPFASFPSGDVSAPVIQVNKTDRRKSVFGSPQSRSGFMSIIATSLPAKEVKSLTVEEFEALVLAMASEVIANPEIRKILQDAVEDSLSDLNSD
ncbi:hypothetical protein [Blastopirellula retiformator]|uniref:Uncharacterized protein n=1 Tax=Blastopirellula retiformator TaxID=2527970 RepID=A0A5C5VLL7_9BACT|nr:hypothetical protein [Blastopirellula retiformator]TWT38917.1 hypothetical protein Enr8_06110 [Blastopirellula retiformator]